jgi:hypothetical protein
MPAADCFPLVTAILVPKWLGREETIFRDT